MRFVLSVLCMLLVVGIIALIAFAPERATQAVLALVWAAMAAGVVYTIASGLCSL